MPSSGATLTLARSSTTATTTGSLGREEGRRRCSDTPILTRGMDAGQATTRSVAASDAGVGTAIATTAAVAVAAAAAAAAAASAPLVVVAWKRRASGGAAP